MPTPRDTKKRPQTKVEPAEVVEARLDVLQSDLARLKQQIRQSQRLAALGTSAAMFAHEVNNMMTPIVGYARFAINKGDPETMTKALQTTLTQADTLIAMAGRILGLVVNEPVSFKPVVVAEAVANANGCLCRELSKDGITLNIEIPEGLKVWADAKQLQQVLFNLLLNARDALDSGNGTISVRAHDTDEDTIVIRVSDTGHGIKPEHLDLIFDNFFTTKRADCTNGVQPRESAGNDKSGSGLGLSICRDIIEEHRGTITAESEVGQGTTFAITLPSAD